MREINESDELDATVYEYRGHGGRPSDIVDWVKSHHAKEEDVPFRSLTGKKIGSGGSEEGKATVIILEESQ